MGLPLSPGSGPGYGIFGQARRLLFRPVCPLLIMVMLLIIDNYDDNAVAHLGGREEEGAGLATLPLPQAPSISLHLRVAY